MELSQWADMTTRQVFKARRGKLPPQDSCVLGDCWGGGGSISRDRSALRSLVTRLCSPLLTLVPSLQQLVEALHRFYSSSTRSKEQSCSGRRKNPSPSASVPLAQLPCHSPVPPLHLSQLATPRMSLVMPQDSWLPLAEGWNISIMNHHYHLLKCSVHLLDTVFTLTNSRLWGFFIIPSFFCSLHAPLLWRRVLGEWKACSILCDILVCLITQLWLLNIF